MNTKRQITPHKGGRTTRLYIRIKPEVKARLEKMAKELNCSIADLIEVLPKLIPDDKDFDFLYCPHCAGWVEFQTRLEASGLNEYCIECGEYLHN